MVPDDTKMYKKSLKINEEICSKLIMHPGILYRLTLQLLILAGK